MTEAMRAALEHRLAALFGGPARIDRLALLGGGASMEAWAVDAQTPRGPLSLLVRRSAGGRIYPDALSLEQEHAVLQAAWEAGAKVPQPCGYLEDLLGRDAFVMERLQGETVGRRIVQRPEFAAAREALAAQMATELARIHALDPRRLDFLPGARDGSPALRALAALEAQLDALGEPHPAIELGLLYLREHLPTSGHRAVCHGDFRVGNLVVDPRGLVGILDWEFAHLGDPREDLAWPMVRAWRFGMDHLRLGGFAQPEEFLERYSALAGRSVTLDELFPFELLGNVRWAIGALAQARRHLSGEERSVELAVLGRLAAEVEHEILLLLEERGT